MTRFFLAAIIFFQSLFSSSESFASRTDCKELIGGSYWILPPKGQRLVVGLLAETATLKKVLAIADYYWGSHEKLDQEVRKKFPVKRVLWAGEALLENDRNRQARGVIVLSINASGYVWSKAQEVPSQYRNDPRSLRRNLEKYRSDLISKYTQYFTYNVDHAHLDPFFQNLHERLRFSKDDTVRHRFLNVLQVMVSLSNYFSKTPTLSLKDHIDRMERVSLQMVGDMLMFLTSQSRFSKVKPTTDVATLLTTFKNMKKPNAQAEQDLFVKLVEVIRSASGRASLADEEPEILVLNPRSR